MALTKQQIENIQIDYGIVFTNYGETDQAQLGPVRGGGEFTVTKNIRDIEFDGRKGKTKGLQIVDEINAQLKVTHLDASLETLKLAMPYAKYNDATGELTCDGTALGVIPDSAYLKNITMFAKVIGGGYKKIALYNALSEADFSLNARPKGEGEMPFEVYAHWDPSSDSADLFSIEDVSSIVNGDTTGPTVVTDPVDGGTVGEGDSLTATFNEDVKQQDITNDNFTLIETLTGDIVDGELTYSAGSKTATFTPTAALGTGFSYIWIIANVRDVVGNKMNKVAVNFTVA